ncbi:hypothetical protein JCM11491_007138 [Sporobolomyces phaffii]
MERTASPARSTRSTHSNLIRSYTTSSDYSASEQLAAIAKAREERRKEREENGRFPSGSTRSDTTQETIASASVQELEDDGDAGRDVVQDGSTRSSLPKVRVQPTSDSSFTPSVPSTPSQSSRNVIDRTSITSSEPDPSSSTAPSPLRHSFELAEIPPFRPKTSSPTQASPDTPTTRSPPPTNVVLSGGLLDRLKAQRAAAQASRTASEPGSPSPSIHGSNESERAGPEAGESIVLTQPEESAIVSPTRSSFTTPLASPPGSVEGPLSPPISLSGSVPPLTHTSTAPSSFVAPGQDEEEGGDALSELSQPSTNRARNKSRSRIYGRYGEEIEYDFTALSDVQERSERSSMSTMPGSLWQSRIRQTSVPASATPSPDTIVDYRIDATAQLLARDRSAVARPRSPIRITSPEIARRASHFEAPASPAKAAELPPLPLPPTPVPEVRTPADDSLGGDDAMREIERRRTARRARLDSIRNLYAPVVELAPFDIPSTDRDSWGEIEREERAQATAERCQPTFVDPQVPRLPQRLVSPFSPPPTSPNAHTLCEGYLSVPSDDLRASDTTPPNWITRYSVLDSETLSFRPTDRTSLTEPLVVFALADCDRLEDETATTGTHGGARRPFSVVLKSGERVRFACDSRHERVRWVSAFGNAIRGSKREGGEKPLPTPFSSEHPQQTPRTLPEFATPPRHDEEQSRPSPAVAREKPIIFPSRSPRGRPLSADLIDRFEHGPLPDSPSFDESIRSRQGHLRSRSDLSVYRTPDHAPPHRPSPTRPKSFHFRSEAQDLPDLASTPSRSSPSSSSITYHAAHSDATTRLRGVADSERSLREGDTETLTTRRGVDTASEKARWKQTLREYELEANQFSQLGFDPRIESRVADRVAAVESTIDGDHQRRPPTSTARSGFRLPLGKKAAAPSAFTSDHFAHSTAGSRQDPFANSAAVQPQPSRRPQGTEERRPGSLSSGAQSRSGESLAVEDLLCKIRAGLENQQSTFQDDKARQELQAQAISALAHWVTEDTRTRHAQYSALGQAVEDVVRQIAALPEQLLGVLQNGPPGEDSTLEGAPERRGDDSQEEPLEQFGDKGRDGARLEKTNSRRLFGINPLSSFARPDRQSASEGDLVTRQAETTKQRGPRMPGFRIWGAPDPVMGNRDGRWGGKGLARDPDAQASAEDGVDAAAHVERLGDAPLADTMRRDPRVRETLEALTGAGGELDADTMSHAVHEILSRVRDLGQRQTEQATRTAAEERKSSSTPSAQEVANLEARRAEMARIEHIMTMNAERTSKLDEMVAQLAKKSDKTESLLCDIAKTVKEGRTTTMDPALTGEVKKLLGGVQSGVDAHVADFRGELTSEVQRMFKEVGKLRDEKKTLQTEIAELMAFHAKYGGTFPKPNPATTNRDEAQIPTQDPAPPSTTFGFYGPRPLK